MCRDGGREHGDDEKRAMSHRDPLAGPAFPYGFGSGPWCRGAPGGPRRSAVGGCRGLTSRTLAVAGCRNVIVPLTRRYKMRGECGVDRARRGFMENARELCGALAYSRATAIAPPALER